MNKKDVKGSTESDSNLPLGIRNYKLLLIGFLIIVLGYVLMSGGTKATADEFSYDIFSWRRITLAPLVLVAGFVFEIYAILKK